MNPLGLALTLSGPVLDGPIRTDLPHGLEVMVATATIVPVLGETQVYTRSLLLVDYEVQGAQLIQRQQLCAVEVDDDARLSDTLIPRAFVEHFPVQVHPIALADDGGSLRYLSDPGPVSIGYDPRLGKALPEHVESPGVLDWDDDGLPGATVKLDVPVLGHIDLFIVQRGHTVLVGEVSDDGRVSGQVDLRALDQHTLGASHSLFHASPPTRFVPERSHFRIEPLAPGASCETLVASWGRPAQRRVSP